MWDRTVSNAFLFLIDANRTFFYLKFKFLARKWRFFEKNVFFGGNSWHQGEVQSDLFEIIQYFDNKWGHLTVLFCGYFYVWFKWNDRINSFKIKSSVPVRHKLNHNLISIIKYPDSPEYQVLLPFSGVLSGMSRPNFEAPINALHTSIQE